MGSGTKLSSELMAHIAKAIEDNIKDEDKKKELLTYIKEAERDLVNEEERTKKIVSLTLSNTSRTPAAIRFLYDTGLFYFLTGCSFIAFAFVASGFKLNSSLIFVVAVLGIAVLLYGTGSQSAGSYGSTGNGIEDLIKIINANLTPDEKVKFLDQLRLSTDASNNVAKFNIAIAGGAAVLAALFGFGIISNSSEIRRVFRDYDTYFKVRVEFCKPTDNICAPRRMDAANNDQATTPFPAIGADDLKRLVESVILETGSGNKLHYRRDGSRIEAIVLERELGAQKIFRLSTGGMINTAIPGVSITVNEEPFNIDNVRSSGTEEQNTLNCLKTSTDNCLLRLDGTTRLDEDRVDVYLIRALVSPVQQPLPASGSTIPVVVY